MSLKRYAIIAAVTRGESTITTTSLPTSEEEEVLHSQELASSSSITTYYNGGMGLYNQQRGIGAGISLLNGAAGSGSGSSSGGGSQSYAHVVNGSVNLLLGGSMLCLVTTILCVVCYCCHRNIKKRTEAAYRQQQHQWLENDPNMEIYSVEQCYETSGLFLGDSTDGLATLPALHHEPPPSYDAVVLHEQQLLQQQQQQLEEQQLQLQQQQLMLQRVSPPPGYRSTLDISSAQQGIEISNTDVMAGSSSSSCSNSNAAAAGAGPMANKQLQRTLNAQSCCSLQRAEVENMWNAAAAAVAARSGHCQELDTYVPMPMSMDLSSSSPPLPLALQARKHAQAAMRLNSFGRRYLQYSQHQHHQQQQHNHYRRGCPLCGKFRYAAEDEALTASVESVLEQCDANENEASAQHQQQQQPEQQQQQYHQQQQQQPAIENPNQIDADAANGNVVDSTTEAASATVADIDMGIDENDNAAATSATAAPAATSSTAEADAEADAADLDINNMNENGIISLDMSKIIDISGLPTYEGALKLESSGYV
ncbi:PREDICTED: GATA zinc finger domain-containing protein 5 [Drosophila arizonae]|uniref:GATA zinc finger domain-containing protein 5 n=1 Tax=Drosophila arizonae TaxID=7263 RepID=A0ABM1PBD2_DROAR|nr:PREDICTED: GATA zinc finger domain-containing protein 5 [Drosophila arizonae]